MSESKFLALEVASDYHNYSLVFELTESVKELIKARMAAAASMSSADNYFAGLMYRFNDFYVFEDLDVDYLSACHCLLARLPGDGDDQEWSDWAEPVTDIGAGVMIVDNGGVLIRFYKDEDQDPYETAYFDTSIFEGNE